VEVQPTTTTSTITLATVYRLGLLPKLDRFGRNTCDTTLSIPTSSGFYTSQTPLRCSHTPGENDIVLGSDWISATGSVFCDNGPGLLDPSQSVIASLPDGYYWSPNRDRSRFNHSIDADLVIFIMNKYLDNDPMADISVFFAAHGMDVDDRLLDDSDVLCHLMNGYCASHW